LPLRGRGKFYVRKDEKSGLLYIPIALVNDSQFILRHKQPVEIVVDPKLNVITIKPLKEEVEKRE